MYGIDEEALFRVFEIAIIEQAWEGISDHIVVRLELMELTKAAQEAGDDVYSFWATDVRFNHTVWARSPGVRMCLLEVGARVFCLCCKG